MRIRRGTEADVAAVQDVLREVYRWLVARGRVAQWGTHPSPQRMEQMRGYVVDRESWVAEVDGRVVGMVSVAPEGPDDLPAVAVPEMYVRMLFAEPGIAGVGRGLLEHVVGQARERGLPLVRVDCFAGIDDRLVDFYRGCGFTEQSRFDRDGWLGCVLAREP